MLGLNRAIVFGMDINPGTWAVYSIPHSMSDLVFGSTKKYTSNREVRNAFTGELNTDKGSVNGAINRILRLDKAKLTDGLYLWENEDKGIIDFVSMSFSTFGFKVQSILYFYFLIIFISSLAFIISNFYSISRLAILLQFFVMIYLVLPVTSLHGQLSSLTAPRTFPVLSIIATIHCILFVFSPKNDRIHLSLVALQSLIIIFTIHLRIVSNWQLFAIVIATVASLGIRHFNKIYFKKAILVYFAPIIFLASGLVALQMYKIIVIPIEYKKADQPLTRVVWHNMFSGFAFNPQFTERYKIKIDDRSIIDAAGNYLIKNGRENEWLGLGILDGGGREAGYPLIRWSSYDQVVKEMFFTTCREFPLQCIKTLLLYKPASLLKTLGWAYGLRHLPPDLDIFISDYKGVGDATKLQVIETTQKLDQQRLRAYLWTSEVMILLGIVFFLMFYKPYDLKVLAGIFIFSICSFIPSIVGYPGAHTVLDAIIVGGLFIYTLIGIFLHVLFHITRIVCGHIYSSYRIKYNRGLI